MFGRGDADSQDAPDWALPRPRASRPHFYCLYLPFFSPPPPPKAANCPCQQKGSQLCKKRDVKNPTRTPLFYCAFPRFKANPNPKLFYSGGVLMFIAERVRRYSIISLQHPPYMQPRRGGVQKSLNPLSYSFIFVLKKDGG